MLNPGKVGSPWPADPGLLIGMAVRTLAKSIRLSRSKAADIPICEL